MGQAASSFDQAGFSDISFNINQFSSAVALRASTLTSATPLGNIGEPEFIHDAVSSLLTEYIYKLHLFRTSITAQGRGEQTLNLPTSSLPAEDVGAAPQRDLSFRSMYHEGNEQASRTSDAQTPPVSISPLPGQETPTNGNSVTQTTPATISSTTLAFATVTAANNDPLVAGNRNISVHELPDMQPVARLSCSRQVIVAVALAGPCPSDDVQEHLDATLLRLVATEFSWLAGKLLAASVGAFPMHGKSEGENQGPSMLAYLSTSSFRSDVAANKPAGGEGGPLGFPLSNNAGGGKKRIEPKEIVDLEFRLWAEFWKQWGHPAVLKNGRKYSPFTPAPPLPAPNKGKNKGKAKGHARRNSVEVVGGYGSVGGEEVTGGVILMDLPLGGRKGTGGRMRPMVDSQPLVDSDKAVGAGGTKGGGRKEGGKKGGKGKEKGSLRGRSLTGGRSQHVGSQEFRWSDDEDSGDEVFTEKRWVTGPTVGSGPEDRDGDGIVEQGSLLLMERSDSLGVDASNEGMFFNVDLNDEGGGNRSEGDGLGLTEVSLEDDQTEGNERGEGGGAEAMNGDDGQGGEGLSDAVSIELDEREGEDRD